MPSAKTPKGLIVRGFELLIFSLYRKEEEAAKPGFVNFSVNEIRNRLKNFEPAGDFGGNLRNNG
jgi:hypothetical protein